MKKYNQVALIILDGWGIRENHVHNPTKLANLPNYDNWLRNYESSIVDASEEFVGLSKNQMGNSEVGHLNLGSGSIVYQDITRINKSIKERSFFDLDALKSCVKDLKNKSANIHLVGLLSDGGVHSHQNHLYALIDFFVSNDLRPIIHIITDGRDTPPRSALKYLDNLVQYIDNKNVIISTISGRFYAMDRDKRWERTELAYRAIVQHSGKRFNSPIDVLLESYKNKVSDEFILPSVIKDRTSSNALSKDDHLIFFNFRADRMRQLVSSIMDPNFDKFVRPFYVKNENVITFTRYDNSFNNHILFQQQIIKNPLARVISDNNLTQFHAAETEKYAHVTYFFNGRREEPFKGEERLLIPSPNVQTYDLKPEMSAYELTTKILERFKKFEDNFILINFANPDMVGHTGVLGASIRALEVVDECAGKIVRELVQMGGVAIVTSDHGNVELMFDEFNCVPHTSHTTNPVRLFVISNEKIQLKSRGILADIAPTILNLLGINKPEEMTGESLIKNIKFKRFLKNESLNTNDV